jgi:WD40-like Beta Propeller Repeat
MSRTLTHLGPGALAASVLLGAFASTASVSCGSKASSGAQLTTSSGTGNASGTGGQPGTGTNAGGGLGFGGGTGTGPRSDFTMPILDMGAPADAQALFAPPGTTSGGPCLYEPELGALIPRNWLRPRFRFTAPNGENLFEITIVVPDETSPLVIYTTQTTYTLDAGTWQTLAAVAQGNTLQVTVRSAVLTAGAITAGPWTGSAGAISIAPVDVDGSIVYWTTSSGTVLKGFKVGDETVQPVITPTQAGTACVACHNSTPGGEYVALTGSSSPSDGTPSQIRILSLDGTASTPSFISASATTLMARVPQYYPVFSKAHWQTGDHTMLSMIPSASTTDITWTDLEATATDQGTGWGIIARTGDPNGASAPTFSHDGTNIVYSSGPGVGAGTITATAGALYTVPYNNRAGGTATPIPGASDPAYNSYYPIFAPDDQLLAFNRVPAGQTSYNDAAAEVFVIPTAGGTATRLAANDPPACLGVTSPGVTNSWAKWAPTVTTVGTKSYYFLVFASTRNQATGGPQLYVTPVVVEGGTITTYSALYLWNQPEMEHNHTPAWDTFQIPPPT